MTLLLLQLLACAVLISRGGFVLCLAAERLADAHGWRRGWVGLAMLATVTSLPELVSGASAVLVVAAPNLAAGGALGACVFNLAFLVVVEALQGREPIYRKAASTHLLSAAFGVVMLGAVALGVLIGERAPVLLHVGAYSPALLLLYFLALRSVQRYERDQAPPSPAPAPHGSGTRAEWRRFTIAAVVVVAAALWLPHAADQLASRLGLTRSFVGTVLVAMMTTLPEVAVTLSALRLRALDLAIANLLGSNLFNVAVLAIDDALYLPGPLLAAVRPVHAATAVSAAVMTGLVMIGLVLRPQGRVLRRVSWIGVGLGAAYLLNASFAWLQGGN